MSGFGELITPNFGKPQMTPQAATMLREKIIHNGLVPVDLDARRILSSEQGVFAEKLDEFTDKLGATTKDADAYLQVGTLVKYGAEIALLGYHQSGITSPIRTPTINAAEVFAELGGIPETFVISTLGDTNLFALLSAANEADDVRDIGSVFNDQTRSTLLHMGGGFVRLHFEQELAA